MVARQAHNLEAVGSNPTPATSNRIESTSPPFEGGAMSLGLILVIVALVLFALDMILWNAVPGYGRYILTPLGGVLLCIALILGTGVIA